MSYYLPEYAVVGSVDNHENCWDILGPQDTDAQPLASPASGCYFRILAQSNH